jgi:hypothetical protein
VGIETEQHPDKESGGELVTYICHGCDEEYQLPEDGVKHCPICLDPDIHPTTTIEHCEHCNG